MKCSIAMRIPLRGIHRKGREGGSKEEEREYLVRGKGKHIYMYVYV